MAIEIVDYEGMLSTLPLPLSSSLSNANDNNAISICQVCLEPFRKNIRIPKLLPCGHSFCNDCIIGLKFNSISICKCPVCRHSFPVECNTKFPTNYSLLDLLDHFQSSTMTRGSIDQVKVNKLKCSKIPRGLSSSRFSNFFSRISRKDKMVDVCYASAEAPFTSTPDMSGEEDGVEVSYVETESDNSSLSDVTVPVSDCTNAKSTPVRMIYVDSGILDDSTTATTTVASADYTSRSAYRDTNAAEHMVRNIITCPTTTTTITTTDQQQFVQSKAQTVAEAKNYRKFLVKIWYFTTACVQLFLAIFVLFWCCIIAKILYDDYYNNIRSRRSMFCGPTDLINKWLWFDLTETFQCNSSSSSTFLQRLQYEAKVFITFLLSQLRYFSTIYLPSAWIALLQFYDEYSQRILQKMMEIGNEYYEMIWIDHLKKYCNLTLLSINDLLMFLLELYKNTLDYLGFKDHLEL